METVTLTRADVDEISENFKAISERIPLRKIKTKRDYRAATQALNALLDAGGSDEKSPIALLVTMLGDLIADYEDAHAATENVPPAEMLRFLMEQHRLTQSDLPEIGSQGVVSEILNGKRELNVRQIKQLASRFNVGPQAFI